MTFVNRPAHSLREEPQLDELRAKREERKLIEYRDQVDRGLKVAFPAFDFGDGLGADPEPRLTPEAANYVAGELEDMRSSGMAAAKIVDGKQPSEIHQRLMAVLAEIDAIQAQLAEKVGGAS